MNRATDINGFLFDLDGTLLDSAPDLTLALNKVRADYQLPPMPVETVRAGVSRGAAGMLALGFPGIAESEYRTIRDRFLEYYGAGSTELSQPFTGVSELLDQLDADAVPWGIVTNKSTRLTLPIVTELGWHARARIVVCGDTTDQPKPAAKPVILACDALAIDPQEVIMIGDDPRDIQAGKAAGCHTAAVAWGYGDIKSDGLQAADYVYAEVSDITAMAVRRADDGVTG